MSQTVSFHLSQDLLERLIDRAAEARLSLSEYVKLLVAATDGTVTATDILRTRVHYQQEQRRRSRDRARAAAKEAHA